MKTLQQILEYGGPKISRKDYLKQDDFKPHMMYDPETGKGYKAEKPEDHERMKKMGYTHDKPELEEGRMKELHGYIDKGMSAQQIAKKMKLDVKTIKSLMDESVNESKSSTGYDLYHKTFSGAMQHSYAFAKKKFGIEVDPDEIDNKVAMGPKKPSKGKTNSYRLKGKDGKKGIQVQVANLDNKRYELNMYKESVQLDESVIDDVKDIVAKKQAKKIQGVMVDMFTASAISQIYDKVNDTNKAKMEKLKITKLADLAFKIMKKEEIKEGARDDARRAMSADPDFKDKDSKDIKATDDDRKAADKNPIIQLRRISDLPKGGKMEFKDKKTAKISQADAKKALRGFNAMRKAKDKVKYTDTVGKSLADLKRILKIIR